MATTLFDTPVRSEVTELKENLGSPSSASGVTGADAFSKISTLNSKIGDIGVTKTGSNGNSTVNVPSGTATVVSEITLQPGLWIIISSADWAANASGYRQIAFNIDPLDPARYAAVTSAGLTGKEVYQQQIKLENVSTETTYKLYARQNSGSTLTCYPFMQAIRIR